MKHYARLIKLALLSAISFHAVAEDIPHLKPLQIEPDINSVDLLSGKYYPTLPTLSIPAAPRLTFETMQKFDSKITGKLYPGPGIGNASYSLTYGERVSEFFECEGSECEAANNTGSILNGSMSNGSFIYKQGSTGIKVFYNQENSYIVGSTFTQGTWYAGQIVFPDNEMHTITYDSTTSGLQTYYRPTKVSSNIGYELHITYASNSLGNGWGDIASAQIVKTSNSAVVARQTYSGTTTKSVTDLAGRAWRYTGFSNALGNSDTAKNFTLKKPSDSNNSIAVASATDSYAGVSHSNFVTSVTAQGVTYNYDYVAKSGTGFDPRKQFSRVTITGPQNYNRQVDLQVTGAPRPKSLITADRDSAGNTTHYTYTSFNRLKSVQHPEGNKEIYSYDTLGNLIEKRLVAKPGSGLADIVVSADYDIIGCVGMECYRPSSVTDAKGNVTNFTFDSSHGGLLTKLLPADDNGERRLLTNTYQSISGVVRLVKTSVCALSDCGTEDEQITQYTYLGKTKLPLTVKKTNGAGTLSQTVVSYSYDNAGRVTREDGPLSGYSDATYYRYDNAGRKTWETGLMNQAGYRVAKRYSYRAQDNQAWKIETGTVTTASSTSLAVKTIKTISFNSNGLPIKTQLSAAGAVKAVTQTNYDGRNRELCTATRMNPSQFGSLPGNACSRDTTGEFGQDRVVIKYHDALSRLTKQISGYDTSAAGIDMEITYTNNGQVATRADGNGNTTSYTYDGMDRLRRTTFPDNSYEQNSYDASGNRTSWRKRDGKIFYDYYDAVNLKTHTAVPSESTIYYNYDGLGRQVQVSRTGSTVSSSYDGLGRLKTSTTNGRTLTYAYDVANRRTRLTHPDGYYLTYSYDYSGALTSLKENGQVVLASYTYDSQGRMQRLDRGNDVDSTMAYDAPGRVSSFNHVGVNNASFGYNPASQLISRVVSNADFEVQIPGAGSQSYSRNSLNQYTQVAGKSISYDNNGNLKSYDGWTYNYNAHNRLTSATKSGKNLALAYDATGRLYSSTYNGTQTRFLYDGDELIAEYNSSGTLLRRYVHGVGTDDPLVQYNGSGTANKVYLLADERGSIIAETNATGGVQTTHKYGPYGEPMNSSSSRFRYTGQILLPGTELYHYKARVYHPKLGRFMQTDPIGYKDGMNWYAYVGNDPVNLVDPLGLCKKLRSGRTIGCDGLKHFGDVSDLNDSGNDESARRQAFRKELNGLAANGTLSEGHSFDSADAAAKAVLSVTAKPSAHYRLEIAGSIYKDEKGYHYTLPQVFGSNWASASPNHIGYHTHPSGSILFSNRIFGPEGRENARDTIWVNRYKKPLYVGAYHEDHGVRFAVCEPGNCSSISPHRSGGTAGRVIE